MPIFGIRIFKSLTIKEKIRRVIFHNQLESVENKVKRMMSLTEDLKLF